MSKKYELVNQRKDGLYQVKALKSFNNVKKGDLGGWVAGEHNLSHAGVCWAYDSAEVFEDAKVFGDAAVSGTAEVSGTAKVGDSAEVFGNAKVCDSAEVFGKAWVSGNAWVYGNAKVYGNAEVYEGARVFGNAKVREDARVYGNAKVHGRATPGRETQVKETNKDKIVALTAKQKEKPMTGKIKQTLIMTRQRLQPYERYILAAAILVAMDYFIFKGGLSDRIKKLSSRLATKLENLLDSFLDKLTLGVGNAEDK